jgi:hypothetical protein
MNNSMKKVILLLAVALCTAANIFSQSRSEEISSYMNAFEADSVVWKSHKGLNMIHETLMYGDTLVNGEKWRILNIGNSPDGTNSFSLTPFTKGLLRTENRKVIVMPYPGYEERFWPREETVLFDFSLEVGEYLNEYRRVSSIDSIELNDGRNHKRMHFREGYLVYDDDYWSYSEIVEGLGSTHFDLLERLVHTPLERPWYTLICCYVDGKLLYMNPVFLDCEGNKVANEIIGVDNPKPAVVFADGNLHVTFNDDALFDVTVYNMQGKMVFQNKNNRNEMITSLENLPKGVYVVSVHWDNYVYSEKIMK